MKLFVLGATGGTGRAVVEQAIARGHHVTAFVRSPEKLSPQPSLDAVRGDPRNLHELERALGGQDVVISALGARTTADGSLLTASAASVVRAMAHAGPKRLLVVSTALLFPKVPFPGSILRRIFAMGIADSKSMERVVADSHLDWTIFRPPRLTNKNGTGQYRLAVDALPPGGFFSLRIARSDLGRALVDEAEASAHGQKLVGVST